MAVDPTGVSGGPRRFCREPRDFELAAADWMRYMGFDDAAVTPPGADGGLDVIATGAVAQVKAHQNPIGSPEVQQLRGVAHDGRLALFFSLTGYTPAALSFAEAASVALFRFAGYDGSIEVVNGDAQRLMARAPEVAALRDFEARSRERDAQARARQAAAIADEERAELERIRALPLRQRLVAVARRKASQQVDGAQAKQAERRYHQAEVRAQVVRQQEERAEAERQRLSTTKLRVEWAARARRGEMKGAALIGFDLSGMDLRRADLAKADLRNANLSNANMAGAYLVLANLQGVVAHGTDLSRADLSGADLRGTDLRMATMTRTQLRGALVEGAQLPEKAGR